MLEKEESIGEALVHLQLEEILVAIIKKNVETTYEFHIMVHQVFGHMILADSVIRKYYAKNELYLSLIPLIDCQVVPVVHSALSILIIALMTVMHGSFICRMMKMMKMLS